jgi:hypothetical protein
MNLTAAINILETAMICAKQNKSGARYADLKTAVDILRTHESQGTGPARSAGDGGTEHGKSPTAPEKPTLVLQWGGSRELKGTL